MCVIKPCTSCGANFESLLCLSQLSDDTDAITMMEKNIEMEAGGATAVQGVAEAEEDDDMFRSGY